MNIRKALFGPKETENAWRQLCRRIGGTFVEGSYLGFGSDKVQLAAHDSLVTLDTLKSGEKTHTRLRAVFWNEKSLRFRLARVAQWNVFLLLAAGFVESLRNSVDRGWLQWMPSRLVELLRGFCARWEGLSIPLGDPEFDTEFHITGNDPARVRDLLGDPAIIALIRSQPKIRLKIKSLTSSGGLIRQTTDSNKMTDVISPEISVLCFQEAEVIHSVERLEQLFELFTHLVRRLANESDDRVDRTARLIEVLSAPGNQIREMNAVLWDGNRSRCRAARELGRLKVSEAVPLLCRTAHDADPGLRLHSVRALNEIADPAAAPALIPLLGEERSTTEGSISEAAALALRKLGEGELVSDFFKLFQRDPRAAMRLKHSRCQEVVQALRRRLPTVEGRRVADTAWALSQLGAVEALPELKALRLRLVFADSEVKEDWKKAVHELEALAALPRSAEPGLPSIDSLPRSARHDPADAVTLPRAGSPFREIA